MDRKYFLEFKDKSREQAAAIYDILMGRDDSYKEELYDLLLKEIYYFLARNGVPVSCFIPIFNKGLKQSNAHRSQSITALFNGDIAYEMEHCHVCGAKTNLTRHHILPQADYPELKYRPDNILCLCDDCHKTFHQYKRSVSSDLLMDKIRGDDEC